MYVFIGRLRRGNGKPQGTRWVERLIGFLFPFRVHQFRQSKWKYSTKKNDFRCWSYVNLTLHQSHVRVIGDWGQRATNQSNGCSGKKIFLDSACEQQDLLPCLIQVYTKYSIYICCIPHFKISEPKLYSMYY